MPLAPVLSAALAPGPLAAADGLSWLERLERGIVHTITCDWHSEGLGWVFLAAQSKLVPALLVVAAAALLARRDWRLGLRTLFAAGLGWLLAMLVADVMWATIERERPQQVFPVVVRDGAAASGCAGNLDVLVLRSGGSTSRSFPSRHALSVGVFATVLWRARRWLGAVAWLYGLLVCVGRIYSGKHWPTDLLAGLVLGSAVGWLLWRLYPPVARRLGLAPPAAPGPPQGATAGPG